MDYSSIAKISGSGLAFQKARVEAATLNLANIGTVADSSGNLYQPLSVTANPSQVTFSGAYYSLGISALGVTNIRYTSAQVDPLRSYEPGHPLADQSGFVGHPNIDHLNEMMTINSAIRLYEANLSAIQAARTMSAKALEIGSGS